MQNKLELHYFFSDEDKTHSMDAVTRNKCEHELLQIIGTISKELNVHIKVDTEAFDKGGLIEFYTFIGSVEGQTIIALSNLAITILGVILSRIPSSKSRLDKEEQLLSIEEKRLNIELLKKQLEEKGIKETEIRIEKIDFIINNNIKIIKHKSNYYKNLYNYPKVKKISTTMLDENKNQVDKPVIVERKDFHKFFLESDELKPIKDESASIELISPVLKKGTYKWKGIYDKIISPIDFSMKDADFKEKIINSSC